MRNPSLDESPRTANGANTDTSPQPSRPPTDNPPRTAQPQPGSVHRSGFESVLPPEAIAELLTPKRPRILGRPVKGPHGHRGLVLAVLMLLLVAGVVVALWSWQRQSETPAAAPPAPVAPTAQPASLQSQDTTRLARVPVQLVWEWVRSEAYGPVWVQCYATCTPARGGLMVRDPAPHAQLVRDPVPRAELVSMPIGARAE